MKATYLGSNPLTALVRCICARRNFFDKKTWAETGYLPCDKCGGKICYKTMRVIPTRLWRSLMDEVIATIAGDSEERGAEGTVESGAATLERIMRDFVVEYERHPEWLWARSTTKMVEEVRLALARIREEQRGGMTAEGAGRQGDLA